MHLVIDGQPVGKGRPRFVKATGRTYTPKATLLAENEIRRAWEQDGRPRLDEGPISLHVRLAVSRPKGHYTTKGELSAAGLRTPFPARQKPDVDNALKLVMDALNTRAWRDDVQIISATVARRWDRWPSVEVIATAVSPVVGPSEGHLTPEQAMAALRGEKAA